jgi:hypothetical protein
MGSHLWMLGEFLALEQEDGETCEDVKWLWLKCGTTSIAAASFGGIGICPK